MNAMILAAGLGTRMGPHSKKMPKALFPILGETLLDLAIKAVLKANPNRIVINAFHHGEQIEAYVKRKKFGAEVIVSREHQLLGTAGGIKKAEKWIKDGDDFVVMNADIIADPPWDEIISFHKERYAVATLTLRPNPDVAKYSPISINEKGKITKFPGVQTRDHDSDDLDFMFTGVSALSSSIFNFIPQDKSVDIVKDIYTPLIKGGRELYGFASSFPWKDSGTTDHYHGAQMQALSANPGLMPPLNIKGSVITPPVYMEDDVSIGPGAIIGPNVAIYKNTSIGGGARLKNCVLLRGSQAREKEIIENQVVS